MDVIHETAAEKALVFTCVLHHVVDAFTYGINKFKMTTSTTPEITRKLKYQAQSCAINTIETTITATRCFESIFHKNTLGNIIATSKYGNMEKRDEASRWREGRDEREG